MARLAKALDSLDTKIRRFGKISSKVPIDNPDEVYLFRRFNPWSLNRGFGWNIPLQGVVPNFDDQTARSVIRLLEDILVEIRQMTEVEVTRIGCNPEFMAKIQVVSDLEGLIEFIGQSTWGLFWNEWELVDT